MQIREILTPVVDETGNTIMVSNFKDGKLYGLFSVVSNKTVRKKENFLKTWTNKHTNIPSEKMEKTNRGWFIDGYQVDDRSVNEWFALTGNNRNPKPKKWSTKKKPLKKISVNKKNTAVK